MVGARVHLERKYLDPTRCAFIQSGKWHKSCAVMYKCIYRSIECISMQAHPGKTAMPSVLPELLGNVPMSGANVTKESCSMI